MSGLIPMLYSDWWEDLDRPHRLWDQHFGMQVQPEDLFNDSDNNMEVLLYRPNRRNRRRFHPFVSGLHRRGRGTSTIQPDKNRFQVTLDVGHFAADEINVKVVENHVIVEANHEEKEDEHGTIARQFARKYLVPSQCDIEQVESFLSADGILTITAPRRDPPKGDSNERMIKIQYTGKPTVTDYEAMASSTDPLRDLQMHQRALQQHQQHQHQQQGQRGRKNIVKAA